MKIFEDEVFIIPKKSYREAGFDNFNEYLKSVYNKFEDKLKEITFLNDEEKVEIKESIELMKLSLLNYLNGYIGKSFKTFEQVLNKQKENLLFFSRNSSDFIKIKENFNNTFNTVALEDESEYLRVLKENNNEIFFGETAYFRSHNKKSYNNFYRLRKEEKYELKQRKELFHQPFEQLENIKTYRYSIPGFPCLYLGNSLYISYKELNEPDKLNLYASRFELMEELSFADISKSPFILYEELNIMKAELYPFFDKINMIFEIYRQFVEMNKLFPISSIKTIQIELIKNEHIEKDFNFKLFLEENIKKIKSINNEINIKLNENDIKSTISNEELEFWESLGKNVFDILNRKIKELKKSILIYPIVIACSIKVSNNDAYFKSEYIFPQFLMEWIRKENLDGLKYLSTKINIEEAKEILSYPLFINFALPIKERLQNGYCNKLKNYFKITVPKLLTGINILESKNKTGLKLNGIDYEKSEFGKIEDYLFENLKTEIIE